MTRDEALVLLRSGQMPEYRYVQLCDENGWGTDVSKPDEIWRVEVAEARDEIERLRAEVERQDKQNAAFSDTICERDATIADLTEALQVVHGGLLCIALDDEPGMREYVQGLADQARAALARAQGGKE